MRFPKATFALILLGFALFFLEGCNCEHQGSGFVFDKETRQPLEGVEVSLYLSSVHDDTLDHRLYTGAKGEYTLQHSYCTNYMVAHYKEGYVGFVADLAEGDTIWLERLDEEYE